MLKALILAYCVVSATLVNSKYIDNQKTLKIHGNKNETVKPVDNDVVSKIRNNVLDSKQLKEVNGTIPVNKNGTLLKTIEEEVVSNTRVAQVIHDKYNTSEGFGYKVSDRKHYSKDEIHKTFPMLQKIHARITRSKDAIWATITLTALCILLVLAVAQSRMWKDHYYSESQGVPLPNFNERVLFKDVMERKISSLKQFFKKKKHSKEKNETELESLLPPSEWDS